MARIPDEEIERLKREISVERLVTSFGVELKRHGAELMGGVRFMTTRRHPSSSHRKRIFGTAWANATSALGHRLGHEDARCEFPSCG